MKKIKLTQNKYAIVDDDYEWLNQFKWHFSKGYAARSVGGRKNKKYVWMHRLINNTPKDLFTDHINRNKLDNRKCNLRSVNKSQNGLNREKPKNNTSGYKGVYWDSYTNKWRGELRIYGKRIRFGRFINIKDVVFARKQAEKKYYETI